MVTFNSRYITVPMTGNDVRTWQHMLNEMSGAGLAEDGNYGPVTKGAVENWQRFFKLHVDGELGPVTQKSLIDVALIKGL